MTTQATSGNVAIMKALGLDPDRVRALTIRLEPGHAPVVVADMVLGEDDAEGLGHALSYFVLVPKQG